MLIVDHCLFIFDVDDGTRTVRVAVMGGAIPPGS